MAVEARIGKPKLAVARRALCEWLGFWIASRSWAVNFSQSCNPSPVAIFFAWPPQPR